MRLGGNADQAGMSLGGDARPNGVFGNRDFRNQAAQLANDAQDLRRQLAQSGGTQQDLRNVDEVNKALQALKGDRVSAAALDKMKKQRTDTTSDDMFLSGADDAPTKYRPLAP